MMDFSFFRRRYALDDAAPSSTVIVASQPSLSLKSSSSFRYTLFFGGSTVICMILWFSIVWIFSKWEFENNERMFKTTFSRTDLNNFIFFSSSSYASTPLPAAKEYCYVESPSSTSSWKILYGRDVLSIVIFASSCMSAVCLHFLKLLLKHLLRPMQQQQKSTKSMHNVVSDFKDSKHDILLHLSSQSSSFSSSSSPWSLNYFVALGLLFLTIFDIFCNAVIAGHAAFLLHDDYCVSFFQGLGSFVISAFAFYYFCDIIIILPCMWKFTRHLHFVDSSSSAPPPPPLIASATATEEYIMVYEDSLAKAAAISEEMICICEICSEAIVEGQMKVKSPTTDSSTFCTRHSFHVKCFVQGIENLCPACQAPLKCNGLDLIDSCFAWTYILCLMGIAWLIHHHRLNFLKGWIYSWNNRCVKVWEKNTSKIIQRNNTGEEEDDKNRKKKKTGEEIII